MRLANLSSTRLRLLAPVLLAAGFAAAPAPARPFFAEVEASAGDDLTVACSLAGASVTLDGTASTVFGHPAAESSDTTFEWSADSVIFDDPASPTPTASFPPGTTVVTVTVTYTDPAPDEDSDFVETFSSQDEVEIHVGDETPPVLSARATPSVLFPPNHSLREIEVDILAEDSCDTELRVELVSVTSSEPGAGIGDGNTMGDIQEAELGTDDRHFLLRAERQGPGTGRVYTATYRVLDRAGNVSEAVARVTVPHDKGSDSVTSSAPTPPSADLQDAKQARKAAKAAAKAARRAQKQAAQAARRAARRR